MSDRDELACPRTGRASGRLGRSLAAGRQAMRPT